MNMRVFPDLNVQDGSIPIEIGCVSVRPGDILFGDIDGVVVIPAEWKQRLLLWRSRRSEENER